VLCQDLQSHFQRLERGEKRANLSIAHKRFTCTSSGLLDKNKAQEEEQAAGHRRRADVPDPHFRASKDIRTTKKTLFLEGS